MEAGNEMSCREACKVVIDAIETIYAHEDDAEFVRVWLDQTKKACEEALAEPPRQCDAGTPEEQVMRWREFCSCEKGGVCDGCPCLKNSKGVEDCYAKWAQMPYEAKEGGAK